MPFSLSPKQFLKHHRRQSNGGSSSNSTQEESSDNSPVSPQSSNYNGHIASPGFVHPPSPLVNATPKTEVVRSRPSSPLAQPPTTSVDEGLTFIQPGPNRYSTTSRTPSINSLSSPIRYADQESLSLSSDSPKPHVPGIRDSGDNTPMIKILNSNGTSPSGASKRTVLDKVKASPSFVRSSRIFEDGLNSSSPSLSGKTLLLENKAQIEALPKEFHPVLYLINAQKLRTYSTGTFEVLAEGSWVDVDSRLTGNELTMWRNTESEEFKYINLIDYQLEVVNKLQIKLYQDFVEDSQVYIRFESQVEFNQWLSAIILSKFEYVKLNEAFTAVVLSSKASKLSDTHILMSKKRYSKSEFCNIRLPQISSKWLKVYMVIVPSDNKHLGRIEVYQDDKKVNKKHLIAYIANANHVFNVYPELPAMVDFNSIMNLKGEIHINKHFEHLFAHNNSISIPKSDSSSSLLASPRMSHSRSTSVNSTSSFFGSPGTSPKPNSMMTFANRDRSSSNESKQSSKASEIVVEKELKEPKRTPSTFLKKHSNDFIMTDSIYIMPISHPGVSPVETMIRNFIPIIDSFKLYGRPQMLISDRKDANCLLFGLPSLPRYEYLSREHVEEAVAAYAGQELDYEKIISDKIQQLQTKGHRGDGDISNLYNSLNSTSYDLAAGLGDPIDFVTSSSPGALSVEIS